jgi:MFS family permease
MRPHSPVNNTESTADFTGQLRVRVHFFLSCLWCGFNVQWGALLPIVLPAQIADMAGPRKELYNGLVLAVGALVAMVVSPLAGALSDTWNSAPFQERQVRSKVVRVFQHLNQD